MTTAELSELRQQIGSQNKDWIMRFFYNPVVKFLMANPLKYSQQLVKYRIADIKKTPTKEDMLGLVFQLYADEEIMQFFLASYNDRDRTIIAKAVWEGGLDKEALTLLFKKPVVTYSGKSFWGKIELIPELKAAWGEYTSMVEPSGFYANPDVFIKYSSVVLSFPLALRRLLAIHLPKPQGYLLEPVPGPGSNFKVHLTENVLFNEFPRIVAYHGQGGIKYSQKGNPNQASVKKMSKMLKVAEFGTENEFPVRSLLIAGLLGEDFMVTTISDSSGAIIRRLFDKDFQRNQTAPYVLSHLKGLNYLNWNEYRPNTTRTILGVLKQLPQQEWILFDNLKCFAMARFLDILPLRDWILRDKVQAEYIEDARDGGNKVHMGIHEGNINQFVWTPYLAGHVFLLASFGLMDITLDPSVKNQFTAYDNLRALRLTKLGAYVLGLSADYIPPARGTETSLSFDENSPIIRIEGDVALGDTLLTNYATRVSENRYQFSQGKFLKECKSTKDIKNKITLFKQTVGQQLPANWEAYLQELIDNSQCIAPQDHIRVFSIPADHKILQRVIVQDEVLRRLVIKAEHYYILVKTTNLAAFNQRMRELGYVLG
jgi:hypothetical protein